MLDFVERHDAAAQVCAAAGLRGTTLEMSLRYAERRDKMPLDFVERHDVTDDYGNVLYNVTTVQSPRVMNTPTWFAASDTATVTKVPAPYGIPTSTDRIDALTKQVDALREQQAAIVRQLHDISEQMQAVRGDVPFGTLRMAEDAWSVGG